jgi:hypothetical protein
MKSEQEVKEKIRELEQEIKSMSKSTQKERAIALVDTMVIRRDINILLWVLD